MPIYEYTCGGCGEDFELLVRGDAEPACPACGSEEVQRELSLPTVQSETTRALGMKAAKKRDAARARDRMEQRLRYEESHDRHG